MSLEARMKRRDFIVASSATTAGLALGFFLPSLGRASKGAVSADVSSGAFAPNAWHRSPRR